MISYLWDGNKQLSGQLHINNKELSFEFDNFQNSSMSLHIPISKIEKVEIFALYNIAPNGLKIHTKTGEVNSFVMENPIKVKKQIIASTKK